MSWLDRVIEWGSPTWAVQRKAARMALVNAERLTSHRGAFTTRLDKTVRSTGSSADWDNEFGSDRRKAVDRARQLERDNVLAESLLSRSTEAVVGTGYPVQAKTDDPAWNEDAEALWRDWCERGADVRGVATFPEIMALQYRGMKRDGDAGVALLREGSLRAYESDEISDPIGGNAGKNMVDGVELDSAGRPIAYHVEDPTAAVGGDRRSSGKRTRIPAEDFIFLARRTRAGQTRGMSSFMGSFWIAEQLDGLIEGVTVAARMAACFGLIIKKQGPLNGLAPRSQTAAGAERKNLEIEPGGWMQLDKGDEVVQIEPKHPSTNLEAHQRVLIRLLGIPFGVPLGIVLLDFSQANYSSSRAELIQAWQRWRVDQAIMKAFASQVYEWKILNWIREGRLPFRADALKHAWVTPGWQWLDPVAEIKAAIAACDANLDTKAAIVARMGGDWGDLVAQRKREIEDEKAAGLPSVRSALTRDPNQPADPFGGEPPSGAPPGS